MLHQVKILLVTGTALTACAVAAGTIVYLYRKRKKQSGDELLLAEGIARHAELYNGLYEGIYQAVLRNDSTDRDAFKEWYDRTTYIEEDAEFVNTFTQNFSGGAEDAEDAYCAKLEKLFSLIERAGIIRREETELSFDSQTRKAYLYLGTDEPAAGMVCKVMKPCWEYRGQIVEQGIIMKKEG